MEAERIKEEYARRAKEIAGDFYALTKAANLFAAQQRARALLKALEAAGCVPLSGKSILEVGCGDGGKLAELEAWGATRGKLAGIDLDATRAASARARLSALRDDAGRELSPGAEIHDGDASRLPWADGSFDLVMQNTVFTSILDAGMKRAVAAEMIRVLKSGGRIVWYDFFYNNPNNPNVKGVGAAEIRQLFPDFRIRLQRVILAPPIARRVVPITWTGALLLEKLRVLNTHYLGIFEKTGT